MDLRERLLELFIYDPATGFFTNRISRGRAGIAARAGTSSHGYRRITIDYVRYYEHHLAWLYVYGELPNEIDHKNGNSSDNAIDNLRLATRSQNNFNSDSPTGKSGLRGAYFDWRTRAWFSKIQVEGQAIWLGTFNSAEEAHEAYLEAADRYAAEYAFHNREPQPLSLEPYKWQH